MLEKCVVCESDKIVKNQGWLGDLIINCEACGSLLSVPLLVSTVQNDKEEQNGIPKYYLWLSEEEEIREVHAFDSDSEAIRKMIQSGKAVLLESARIIDIAGSELFEGDIVRVTGVVGFHKLNEAVCVIRKSEQYLGLVFYSIGSEVEHRIYYDDSDYVCEYLGNIYLTPEVIEEELSKMK
ncbi:hypothetical protein PSN82_002671 [Enterococcus faecalis]|uniref:YopX family protein n=1 Tax=Enterococcus faecalis TaxID=1351 RepID=UPI00045B30CB|nr:YopX family protein [Enterococcus faecalis]EJG4482915.1 hypothetical protein [Enterococcus faecalis]EKL7559023.1 hypothetical protein [Enterococcus faecalis]KAJ64860.1 hypothetical protein P787_1864 [Enterococcus faecalis MN16]